MTTTTTPAPRLAPGPGWALSIGPTVYDAHKDGRPFGFLDVWNAAEGCRGASIFRPDGSLYLDNAGSLTARRAHMDAVLTADAARRTDRIAAAHVAHVDFHNPARHAEPQPEPVREALARLRAHPAYARLTRLLTEDHAHLTPA